MEQILMNQSKIKHSITFLKPISVAIPIETGGLLGAGWQIIANGGSMGSTTEQLFGISSDERKQKSIQSGSCFPDEYSKIKSTTYCLEIRIYNNGNLCI